MIDDRLDRLDAKIDERFATVEVRFAEGDQRLAQLDRRLEEQRAETTMQLEAWRADFKSLYDFVKAQFERTDARLDQFQAEVRSRFADLQGAIAALAPCVRAARRRR